MSQHVPFGETDVVDLAVIGAGINGLAIARDAAARGLRVVVVDRADVGSGTSSTSSRLIHGGLKYLERYDFTLVHESIRERHLLFRTAPHLIRDYPMLIPFYEGNTRPGALIRLGLLAFDTMALGRGRGLSRGVPVRTVARRWPTLSREGLRGAALFHDAQVPWAERLCVELLLDARRLGARVLTYTSVTGLIVESDRVAGLHTEDVRSGERGEIRAAVTVNAAGPWIDRILDGQIESRRLNGGTKGSHVVLDPFPGAPDTCIFFEAAADGRPIFVFPWQGRYMLGSTDLTYEGDLDEVVAGDAEIDYLLAETNRIFPQANLTPADVLWSVAGIRPLPYTAGVSDNAKISRGHTVLNHAPAYRGLLTVIGGKLTTHRALAEDVTDEVLRVLGKRPRPCVTRTRPFPGADTSDWPEFVRDFLRESPLDGASSRRLLQLYGVRARRVLDLAAENPSLAEVVDRETGALAAEVVMAVCEEGAVTLADVMLRRILVGLNGDMGLSSAATCADVAVRHLGWDEGRARAEVAAYENELRRHRPRALAAAAGGGAGAGMDNDGRRP
ncbi:glycerol-3-phosphate dehydrogenase/oxidase [Microbispora sp. SCL1-1]|uniref:glycerol-3-phosphate dehydrogenase/oxidase n=1 Tax=unclassified Microbispora TaxID=2614687 RepID=UPI00115AB203|nr:MULTISPECIES: glycerol-3-phosphate dehydrogenase/oxidase [unclassified Microbispora]NJP28092.1 glycerol-3-phosphate dehydrogenase/oxidase [Microbispora sp. CL1-1]TQS09450.1 glycerol-3-phosphate dehydrogenase/oxidase [Microbispora sp. SCL1-1]